MKYLLIFLVFVSVALFFRADTSLVEEPTEDLPKIVSVNKIWDQSKHNAFTDLIKYNDALYCTFRESDEHVTPHGTIRILKSMDGDKWFSVASLEKEGFDLRDPHFSITPEGLLMLSLDGSTYGTENDKSINLNSMVTFSNDGTTWSDIVDLQMPGEWIWRISWFKGQGYGVSYRLTNPRDTSKPWVATLFETTDGLTYSPVTVFDLPGNPSETTLQFLDDGTMIAMVRVAGNGFIGHASFPYKTWKWFETSTRFGGPNFIVLPNNKMWWASRVFEGVGKEAKPFTAIGKMTANTLEQKLKLPSGGDTSYPGLVFFDGFLYVSYYSSHEGQSNIYLAKIELPLE